MIQVFLEPDTDYKSIDEFQDSLNDLLHKMQSEDNCEIKEVKFVRIYSASLDENILVACITYDDGL